MAAFLGLVRLLFIFVYYKSGWQTASLLHITSTISRCTAACEAHPVCHRSLGICGTSPFTGSSTHIVYHVSVLVWHCIEVKHFPICSNFVVPLWLFSIVSCCVLLRKRSYTSPPHTWTVIRQCSAFPVAGSRVCNSLPVELCLTPVGNSALFLNPLY